MFRNVSLTILFSGLFVSGASAANIYKYEDANGNTVFDSRIPAEFVYKGYTILNDRGQVVEVVPPAPTAEELAERAEELEQQRIAEEERAKQDAADRLLLRLYRSPQEIVRMRDEKVQQLDAQVIAITASLNKVKQEEQRLQGIVEQNRSGGNEPPANIVSQLESTRKEVDRLSAQIDRIQADREQTIAKASTDIERLSELLNL